MELKVAAKLEGKEMTDDELYWLAVDGMKKSRVYGLGLTVDLFYGNASSIPSLVSVSQQHAVAP